MDLRRVLVNDGWERLARGMEVWLLGRGLAFGELHWGKQTWEGGESVRRGCDRSLGKIDWWLEGVGTGCDPVGWIPNRLGFATLRWLGLQLTRIGVVTVARGCAGVSRGSNPASD
jgi:hypothetical protein